MQHLNTDAAKLRNRSSEVLINYFRVQTDSFKALSSAVGRYRGDSHFRHDLQNALAKGLYEIAGGLLEADAFQSPILDHKLNGFQS